MGIHDGHRARLKTEFLQRPASFPDHKVLEVLLFYANPRADTNPMAHTLLEQFGSLSGVLDAAPDELSKVPGIGPHAAVLIKCVKELASRYFTARTGADNIIHSSTDAVAMLRPYFFGARQEKVCVLCTDGKHRLLGIRQLSEGIMDMAPILYRQLLEAVLSLNASEVILAHNHVSGLALPSPEDKIATDGVRQLLELVHIRLLDHLIFSDDDAVSMRESGFWEGD